MRDFLGTRDWMMTEVIGEGEGGERGLDGRRERAVRNTTAGDATRRPKSADANWDAPAAGRAAAAMLRREGRIAIGKDDDDVWTGGGVVREVVEEVVVAVAGGKGGRWP